MDRELREPLKGVTQEDEQARVSHGRCSAVMVHTEIM